MSKNKNDKNRLEIVEIEPIYDEMGNIVGWSYEEEESGHIVTDYTD